MEEVWYVLREDNSGHTYVIPEREIEAFYKWVETEGEEEQPKWCVRVEGNFKFKVWTD